ncbi:AAA family ATPase [Sphingomonas sp.]|uniref:AAA family ATPase n=1 Tax=Sphingomonas sp. TaxID=28214 RepID=UPI003F7247AB
MTTPTIDGIRHLRAAGIFSDIPVGQFPHKFNRYNLIYGFNGCGKTTLSRLLESISESGLSPNLAEEVEFSFSLSDGSSPSGAAPASSITRYLAVFNEDFVERSLTWKEGAARPIVYIGEDQAALAKSLTEAESKAETATQDQLLKSSEWSSAEKALDTIRRDVGRLIAEQLNLGRKYNATNVKADYESGQFTPEDKISDDERKRLKEILNRSELPHKLPLFEETIESSVIMSAVKAALAMQVSDVTIESLRRRKDALGWVDQGLQLHREETECLFCGNDLEQQRVEALRDALAAGFEKLTSEIDSTTSRVEAQIRAWSALTDKLRMLPEALPAHRGKLSTQLASTIHALDLKKAVATKWLEQLNHKRANPDAAMSATPFPEDASDDKINLQIENLHSVIDDNNTAIDNFANEQEQARIKLKNHYLADEQSAYRAALRLEEAARNDFEKSNQTLNAIRREIVQIRQQIRAHGPAAAELNKLLASYLGHNQITLAAVDDGYRICRNGSESLKPLSEGEKTAVAFCYFITALTAEGRKVSDLVVVLDDPISSLDTRAMTHVVSMIKRTCEKCTQLFVLTHNLDFMREMKKWLGRRATEDLSEFLFIETGLNTDGKRYSNIVKMPKLIREYESEYHYLYSLVKALADDPNGFERFAYLMPNAIRKVLDIFLAFKIPGGMGLGSKVEKLLVDNSSLDAAQVKAMEQLAHLESHSESIGDVITFSAYTLEQVADAARCLMNIIATVDPSHGKAMDRLCRA